jgi:hypothetical protein
MAMMGGAAGAATVTKTEKVTSAMPSAMMIFIV